MGVQSNSQPPSPDLHPVPTDTVVIRPPRLIEPLNLRELWQFRFLIWMFGVRAVKGKYKQSVLGFAWAAITPLVRVVLYTIIFGYIAKFPSGGKPYAVFAFAAMLPWNFFSGVFGASSGCLRGAQALVQKVYFPRLVLPLSSLISITVNTLILVAIQFGLMGYYGYYPPLRALWLIPIMIYAMMVGMGIGLLTAAWSIRYRDVGQFIGIVMQVWYYATPVVYSAELVQKHFPLIFDWYQFNPMYWATEAARWALLPDTPLHIGPAAYATVCLTLLLFIVGLYWFRRTEQFVADLI